MFLNILLALKIRTTNIYISMHSVLSQKNSKFRAVSSGMENCTTSHICDSPVYSHTAATLDLEINQYEGSRVIGQVVCRWIFVPWPRVRCQGSPYGMCGEHSDRSQQGCFVSPFSTFIQQVLHFSLLLSEHGQ